MHQVDEHVHTSDIETLTEIYSRILNRLFRGIIHLHKIQALWRGNWRASMAVTSSQRIGNIIAIPAPFANKFQSAGKERIW